jgi:hypothetical protein
MRSSILLVLIPLALLVGCSTTPISANVAKDVLAAVPKPVSGPSFGGVVQQGLLDASYNLDQGVAVGALDATDPLPGCLHGVLQQLGIDPTVPAPGPGKSFTPRVSDLISEGSVLYIRARQVQKLQGAGVQTPVACKASIGQLMIDAAGAGLKVQPGGGLVVPLR